MASTGGGPGSCWPFLEQYRHQRPQKKAQRVHLRYTCAMVRTLLRVAAQAVACTGNDSHYTHSRYQSPSQEADPAAQSTPSGYQPLGAHGGIGKCSHVVQNRIDLWQALRRSNRQDYRQWKTRPKDTALKVHGSNRPPPMHLKPANHQIILRQSKIDPNPFDYIGYQPNHIIRLLALFALPHGHTTEHP